MQIGKVCRSDIIASLKRLQLLHDSGCEPHRMFIHFGLTAAEADRAG